ncbi:HAD hydrolase-like protein [Streptomyces anulatus]
MAPGWDADVLLVGGTCADVAGGIATGVPVLVVATGRTSRTDLDRPEPPPPPPRRAR